MNNTNLTDDSNRTTFGLYGGVRSDVIFYFVLAAVIFLSYGYEIFNFNLTIDEEIHAGHSGKWSEWISQGRWGMALLNFFVVQNTVTPVVSIFLGLTGLVIGMVLLLKNTFEINQAGILSITALGITTPTLPFTLTFSTLAYGVGFAFLALALSSVLIGKKSLPSAFLACLLAAFAISVYQTFVFALAMLSVVHALYNRGNSTLTVLEKYKFPIIYFFGGVLIYILLNFVVLKVASLDVVYIGGFVDLNGFFQSPIQKIMVSFGRVVKILSLSPSLFGIHSIWLGAVVLASIFFSFVYPLLNKRYYTLFYTGGTLIAIVAVMVLADAIARGGAPLRSLVYFPVGIAIIVACAFTVSGKVGQLILIILCGLAVIGNSQINNHLFASSTSAEFRDRILAETIFNEIRRLQPERSEYSVLKVEVIGNRKWPVTGIQSKKETFGASFFEWGGGNRHRVAAYLNLNGLASIGASEEDRIRIYKQEQSLPIWPNNGWISINDDVLVLKLGDYSAPQKSSLCSQGMTNLCN